MMGGGVFAGDLLVLGEGNGGRDLEALPGEKVGGSEGGWAYVQCVDCAFEVVGVVFGGSRSLSGGCECGPRGDRLGFRAGTMGGPALFLWGRHRLVGSLRGFGGLY